MATTRIISMHVNQGKTIADCLTDRIDYSKNPKKTQGGELISAYECDPKTADAEFLYSKRQYQTITGREQRHDVIAYQVRQSFKPGEITPEDANRIGYEFAERFLKGRHAFFVATHTDKKHIHNHIIWNSTTLDCKHISQKIVIPVAVMLRYVPTIREDWHFIKDAMRMRDVSPNLKNFILHPAMTIECIYVPLMMAASKTADELTVASVTRGIENPTQRTSYVRIGFGIADLIVVLAFLAMFLVGQFYGEVF